MTKWFWIFLVLGIGLALIAGSVSAAEDVTPKPTVSGSPTAKPTVTVTVAPAEKPVKYEPIELFSDDLIKTVKQALGLEPMEQKIVVYFGDEIMGIVPTESKFVDMPITIRCKGLGYGTDEWYKCEQQTIERNKEVQP